MVAEYKSADACDVAKANVSAPLIEAQVNLYPAMDRWGFGTVVSAGSWHRYLQIIYYLYCMSTCNQVFFFFLICIGWSTDWFMKCALHAFYPTPTPPTRHRHPLQFLFFFFFKCLYNSRDIVKQGYVWENYLFIDNFLEEGKVCYTTSSQQYVY